MADSEQFDKQHSETSAPMNRREIEDARAHLKAWFPNQSVERHTFNKLCDQAVRSLKKPSFGDVRSVSKCAALDQATEGMPWEQAGPKYAALAEQLEAIIVGLQGAESALLVEKLKAAAPSATALKVRVKFTEQKDRFDLYLGEAFLGRYEQLVVTPLANALTAALKGDTPPEEERKNG